MRLLLTLGVCLIAPMLGASSVHGLLESEYHRRVFFRGAHFPDFHPRHGETPFAIYDDQGSWDAGKEGFKKFLVDHSLGYRMITAAEILQGELRREHFRVLVMPGGESWQYIDELGQRGAQAIRTFVGSGGGYVGICAGAFYATSHREGGGVVGRYGIGLLQGVAFDGTARDAPSFREGSMAFRATTSEAVSFAYQRDYHWLMLGGPSFRYTAREAERKQIRVLVRIPAIQEPAMLLFQYGLGRVFLSAPHIEVDPSTVDSLSIEDRYQDDGQRVMEAAIDYLLQK